MKKYPNLTIAIVTVFLMFLIGATGGFIDRDDIKDDAIGEDEIDTLDFLDIAQTGTTGNALKVYRNLAKANTDSPVVFIHQDNVGDDQNALYALQDSTEVVETIAVEGEHTSDGTGVKGTAIGGWGVRGVDTTGFGVAGTATSGQGVAGNATTGTGVVGSADGSGGDGVLGSLGATPLAENDTYGIKSANRTKIGTYGDFDQLASTPDPPEAGDLRVYGFLGIPTIETFYLKELMFSILATGTTDIVNFSVIVNTEPNSQLTEFREILKFGITGTDTQPVPLSGPIVIAGPAIIKLHALSDTADSHVTVRMGGTLETN